MSAQDQDHLVVIAAPLGFRIFERCFWSLVSAGVPIALFTQWLLPPVSQSVYRLQAPALLDGLGVRSVIGWLGGMLLAGWAGGFLTTGFTGSDFRLRK